MSETLARLVVGGDFSPDVRAWLQKGFGARILAAGAVPLERCLSLANTPGKLARTTRDLHLYNAWCVIVAPDQWGRSVVLAAEVAAFLARIWPQWRNDQAPPIGASDLRRHLFLAKQAAERGGSMKFPGTVEHLHNIALSFNSAK